MNLRSTVTVTLILLSVITLADRIDNLTPGDIDPTKDESTFSSLFDLFGTKQAKKTGDGLVVKDGKGFDQGELARTIFKGMSGLNKAKKDFTGSAKADQTGQLFEALDRLQNDLIIPRRRGSPRKEKPSDSDIKKIKRKSNGHNFALLNQYLKDLENTQNIGKIQWQNPVYKDKTTGESLPFYIIFGEKKKGKSRHAYVDKSTIQDIIRKRVPFLNQGSVINMISTNYRNGILLKIDYLNMDEVTLEEKIYAITARYRPKNQQLDIISMKESDSALMKDGNIVLDERESSSSVSKQAKAVKKGGEKKTNDRRKYIEKIVGHNQPVEEATLLKTVQQKQQDIQIPEKTIVDTAQDKAQQSATQITPNAPPAAHTEENYFKYPAKAVEWKQQPLNTPEKQLQNVVPQFNTPHNSKIDSQQAADDSTKESIQKIVEKVRTTDDMTSDQKKTEAQVSDEKSSEDLKQSSIKNKLIAKDIVDQISNKVGEPNVQDKSLTQEQLKTKQQQQLDKTQKQKKQEQIKPVKKQAPQPEEKKAEEQIPTQKETNEESVKAALTEQKLEPVKEAVENDERQVKPEQKTKKHKKKSKKHKKKSKKVTENDPDQEKNLVAPEKNDAKKITQQDQEKVEHEQENKVPRKQGNSASASFDKQTQTDDKDAGVSALESNPKQKADIKKIQQLGNTDQTKKASESKRQKNTQSDIGNKPKRSKTMTQQQINLARDAS